MTHSFEGVSDLQLESHLSVSEYGNFKLTDAIRPAFDLEVVPEQGYRLETQDVDGCQSQVLQAAASREIVFDLFIEMLDMFNGMVDVFVDSSHDHLSYHREGIDLPVAQSILYDHEDTIINDGCTTVAVVMDSDNLQEIQFDEHKLLFVFNNPLKPFERILEKHGVCKNDSMKFITEADHVHLANTDHTKRFDNFRLQLGAD